MRERKKIKALYNDAQLPPILDHNYKIIYNLDKPVISRGAWYVGTFMSSAEPEYPRSSAVRTAAFSPISRAVEYVLQPTLSLKKTLISEFPGP